MSQKITAQQIIDRIKKQSGSTWTDSLVDIFQIGQPQTIVSGIVTSYSPTIEVLQKAVKAKKNFIITQLPTFYQDGNHSSGTARLPIAEVFGNDPTYLFKRDFIEKNQLVIWRFHDNWNARKIDSQLFGLAKFLGWDNYHIDHSTNGEIGYTKNNKSFKLPEISLRNIVLDIQNRLNIHSLRVIGNPDIKIKKAVLTHGMFQFSELKEILKDAEVDLIVITEGVEWESIEYFRDLITWGKDKCMIILGREAVEDPGYGEVANWLTTFIPEISIEWISAHEPFWIP